MQKKEYHHYSDYSRLVALKQQSNETIAVVIPTLNEEKCIASIIGVVEDVLMRQYALVDEIVVMDGGSTDATEQQVLTTSAKFVDTAVSAQSMWKKSYATGKGIANDHYIRLNRL